MYLENLEHREYLEEVLLWAEELEELREDLREERRLGEVSPYPGDLEETIKLLSIHRKQ